MKIERYLAGVMLACGLQDLRGNLQALPREQAGAQCSATVAELRTKPKPSACWDLGVS